jgi:hypothetical protein
MSDSDTELLTYPPPRDMACPFDPPPALTDLQQQSGVVKVSIWDGQEAWLISRWQDVRDAFSDEGVSADSSQPGYPEKSPAYKATIGADRSLRTLDNPVHDIQKRMIIGDFTVRRVEAIRPQIQAKVDALIDEMIARGSSADLVRDFAFPIPTMVICEILGVPYADRDFFGSRAETSFSHGSTAEQATQAGEELLTFIDELVDEKTRNPANDLISRLVHEQLLAGGLSRRDVVEMSRLMLLAGHETTANGIALSVLALLQHPDQLTDLVNRDPTDQPMLVNAVDELMRYLSVTHTGRRRVAKSDVTVGGTLIKAGEGLIIANNLADRDETVFPDPAKLDLRRDNARANVAFGYGIHQCPGQLLSRVELQVVHSTLWRRIPSLRLDVPFDQVRFKESGAVYGVYELPVTWDT